MAWHLERNRNFFATCLYQIGNDNSAYFWNQKWQGEPPLEVTFPICFSLCAKPYITVKDAVKRDDGVFSWDLHVGRSPRDWECQQVFWLNSHFGFCDHKFTMILWARDWNIMVFSLSSLYNEFCRSRLRARRRLTVPIDTVWDSQLPARTNFFTWEVAVGALRTKVRLKRNFPDKDEWCSLCHFDADHLLITCQYVSIWGQLLEAFKVAILKARTVEEWLSMWQQSNGQLHILFLEKGSCCHYVRAREMTG